MPTDNISYEPRKNGSHFAIVILLRLIGVLLILGTIYYLNAGLKEDGFASMNGITTSVGVYMIPLIIILGFGFGLALLGIAEIIAMSTEIGEDIRKGLYKNIAEIKE